LRLRFDRHDEIGNSLEQWNGRKNTQTSSQPARSYYREKRRVNMHPAEDNFRENGFQILRENGFFYGDVSFSIEPERKSGD
jgi:hypothetical protein